MDRPQSGRVDRNSGEVERWQPPARGAAGTTEAARGLVRVVREATEPAILVALADRRLLELNDAFSRVVGRHPADLIGLPLERALPRVNGVAVPQFLAALRTDRVAHAQVELLDGERRVPHHAIGMSPDGEIALIRLRPTSRTDPLADERVGEVDLDQVIGDLLPILHRLVGAHTDIDVHIMGRAPSLHADRGELDQLLLNLVAQARDAMPSGGTLTIELEAGTHEAPAAAKAGVAAGVGDYATLRVGDTSSAARQGTGLDLTTVRAIVERLAGSVTVASGPTSGRIVTVRLPVGRSAARASGEAGSARRPVVLLAEDEAPLRALGRRILERHGFEVRDAASGEDAIRVAEESVVDVLVTDVMLPGIRGRELADRIAARHPGIGVLYVSGYAADDVALDDALASGALFLEKPFPPDTLVDLVRELAERRSGPH